ncbi:hypothetical protein LBMAG21_12710 [Armatimonadota bacterium]|nr:hypothetical protein LBMAG21_12710 [Armatimonadota bacterium]
MQTFEGSADAKRGFYALLAMWLFLVLSVVALFLSSPPTTRLDKIAVGFACCLGLTLLAAIVRFTDLEPWARYTLDKQCIKKMTWLETREIRWDEIADFDVRATSPRNSKYRLRGENGSVLVVQPGYTGKKATEFEEVLVAKLAPALRKKREGILHRGKTYFPQRGINFYANLGNGAVFVLASFNLLSPSGWIQDHPVAFLGMTLSAAAYCFADAYFLYRQELRIGKETLEKRTLRSRVVIKLNEITAITQTPQKGYIVHSGATQIPLNASMPDFQFVLEHLSQYATLPTAS